MVTNIFFDSVIKGLIDKLKIVVIVYKDLLRYWVKFNFKTVSGFTTVTNKLSTNNIV